jgi:hypothetical protein
MKITPARHVDILYKCDILHKEFSPIHRGSKMDRKAQKEIIALVLNQRQVNSTLSAALDQLCREQEKRYGPWKNDYFWECICDKLIEARREPGVIPEECRTQALSGNEVVSILLTRKQVNEFSSAVLDRIS